MPPGAQRDALSVRYDGAARRVLMAAIRAHQVNPNAPRAARIFVYSRRKESFRRLDKGGRTEDERAFMRALYYQTWRVPINLHITPDWSPVLEWGKLERRSHGWGRSCRVRLFRYRSGLAKAAARRADRQWRQDLGTWSTGGQRSVPGDRIDQDRRRAG